MSTAADKHLSVKRESRLERIGVLAILCVCLMVLGLFLQQQLLLNGDATGFPLDDAYIHLQFAKNLAAGNGLAFMPDRTVPGSTSPLWTALLAPAFLISQETAIVWSKLLGALLFLVAAVDVSGFARDLGVRRSFSVLAGVLMALTETLAFSALSGMEVPLFVALLVRALRCWAREHERGDRSLLTAGFGLLLVAALVRPEALLLVMLATFERLWPRPAEPLGAALRLGSVGRAGLLAATVLLPTAGLFWLWSGSPLPTTFAVKAGSGHQWLPAVRDLWRFSEVLIRVQPLMVALSGIGAVWLVKRGASPLPVLWLVGLPLAYSALNTPGQQVLLGNFGRYAFPLLPFVVLLGCCGLEETAQALESRWGRLRWLVGAAAALALFSPLTATLNGAGRTSLAVHNVAQSDVAAARWIDQNLGAVRVGAQDIGALGFFSAAEVVDLVGLVNPEVLPYLRGNLRGAHPSGLEGLFRFAEESGVEYLLLFPRSYGGMENLRSMRPGLAEVRRWSIERNVAMAASELLLLRL